MIVGQRVLGGSPHDLYVVHNQVSQSPKNRVVPLPNGHSWIINGGDPNHLLTGMNLQVGPFVLFFFAFLVTNSILSPNANVSG